MIVAKNTMLHLIHRYIFMLLSHDAIYTAANLETMQWSIRYLSEEW